MRHNITANKMGRDMQYSFAYTGWKTELTK